MQAKQKNKTGWFDKRDITELLKALHKKELRPLTKYLKVYGSPGVQLLWKVIMPKYPLFKIKDATIRNSIRPGKPLTQKAYPVLLNDLSKLVKTFITEQEFREDQLLYDNIQAKALINRRAKRNYKRVRQQQHKRLESQKPDAEYYDYLHKSKLTDFQHTTLFDPYKKENSLQEASNYHDYSFLIKKLRYLSSIYNRKRIVNTVYNEQHEEAFLQYLSEFCLEEHPLIKAYFLNIQLFRESSIGNYTSLKNQLLPIRNQFDKDEIRQLLTLAQTICTTSIREGRLDFLKERFLLTKIMVEENFLKVLGHFSNNHFRTTLRDAIEANQLSWAYEFLANKLPLTHPDHRTNLELLGWAQWYFAKGDYEKLNDHLLQMQSAAYQFTDDLNELAYRVLHLKTDYKLLDNSSKAKEIQAFKHHLNRYLLYCKRKINLHDETRQSRMNFGYAVRLLFNARHGKKQSSKVLKTKILGLKPIVELPWLLGSV